MKPNCWKRVSASALVLILMMAPGWAKTLTVSNNRDRGEGTLRQAILDANASPGQNTIVFAIAGPGLKTIAPQSPLPPITGSTVVDGTTQQGYTDSPLIEVSGALLDVSGTDGIQLRAPGAGVRGLAVTRFGGNGISVRATGCTVERNYIGTAGGYADARGNAVGVWLEAANNTSVRANLISGNSLGVYVHATTGARIEANDVGTDSSGLFPLSNEVGILCEDSQSLQIVNNLVSGNWDRGIVLGPGTTSSRVSDNLVGAGVTWDPLGNGTDGISIEDASSCVVENNTAFANWNSAIRLVGSECRTNSVFGNLILGNGVGIDIDHGASSNIIGENAQNGNYISGNLSEGIRISGSGTGGNLIAGNQILTNGQNGVLALATENEVRNNWIYENGTNGVVVGLSATGIPAERVRITGNAIAQNGDLGIRLVSGTTSGGNALQPAPRLSIVSGISGQITVIGSLLAAPNTTYRIEYFRNAVPDASGTGEGESLIGSSTMTTGLHGQGYFTAVLATLSSGQFVTATATDPSGNTSAFSNAIPYTGASDLVITGLSPGSVRRGGPAFTLTVTGSGFTSGCFVRWNGARRQTTFISSTQLTTTISAGDLVGAGQFMVGVETPGGSRSNDLPFFVINPVPVLNSITPEMVMRNAASFTLAADGADFVRESVILWNDKPMTTAYVSPTRLLAKIEPANLGTAQTVTIKVFTAPPYGGTSAGKVLTIANPAPVVTSIAPSFAVAEGKGFLLTVYGQGFVRESEIQWNTESRITTFVSDKELRTTVKAEDITTVGNASVGVVTPPPGGGASAPLNFAIVKDSTAPDTVIVEGPNQNGVACEKNVRFLVTGSDDTTDTPDLRYKYRVDAGAWQDAISVTTINLTDLADGAHVFEVAAVDKAGNADTTPAKRTFSVYSSYLMISNKKISPVTISSAPVIWTTNNPATSEVRWGKTESYEQIPVTNGSYVTSHRLELKGLSSSTTYHVRIYSTDECGRTNQSNDIEFTTPDAPDLTITSVTPPGPALVGDQALFQWTGKNIGKKVAAGKWSDSVYLSADKKWDIDDARLGRVDHTGDIPVGSSYSNQLTAEIPPLTPGNYYVIVRADIGGEVEEAEEWNNDGASTGTTGIDVQEIQVGQVVNGTLYAGHERYYKFRPAVGKTILVALDGKQIPPKTCFVREGRLGNHTDYDLTSQHSDGLVRRILIPDTHDEWYYTSVYWETNDLTSSPFVISVSEMRFEAMWMKPALGGNTGQLTTVIRGAQFDEHTKLGLRSNSVPDNIHPIYMSIDDSTQITATFDLTNKTPSVYDLYIQSEREAIFRDDDTGDLSLGTEIIGPAILKNAFQIVSGGTANLQSRLILPGSARRNSRYEITIDVINTGEIDAPAPYLMLASPNGTPIQSNRYVDKNSPTQIQFIILGPGTNRMVFAPGEHVQITMHVKATTPEGAFRLTDMESSPDIPIEWNELEFYYRDDSSFTEWQAKWNQFRTTVGNTYGSLATALRDEAAERQPNMDTQYILVTDLMHSLFLSDSSASDWHESPKSDNVRHDLLSDSEISVNANKRSIYRGPCESECDQNLLETLVAAGLYWPQIFVYWAQPETENAIEAWRGKATPVIYYDENSKLARGVVASSNVKIWMQTILEDVRKNLIAAPSYLPASCPEGCGFAPARIPVDLLADRKYLVITDSTFPFSTTVGYGAYMFGGVGPGEDARYVSGDVIIRPICREGHYDCPSAWEISLDVWLTYDETFNFCPGNDRDGWIVLGWWDNCGQSFPFHFTMKAHYNAPRRTLLIYRSNLDLPQDKCCPAKDGPAGCPPPQCEDHLYRNKTDDGPDCCKEPPCGDPPVPHPPAIDPNTKAGPTGVGPGRYVAGYIPMRYTVYFENRADAGAWAATVEIDDQLDSTLDWSTFRLGEIVIGDRRVDIPNDLLNYRTRIELGPQRGNLLVDVQCGINVGTGKASWRIGAIDPDTGEMPSEIDVGLLPPNDSSHRGEGYITYTVNQKPSLITGAVIRNQGRITFDGITDAAIDTPIIFNTVDADTPSSNVSPLPERATDSTFLVTWEATDIGSGIGSCSVFVSEDGGAYTEWKEGVLETTAEFSGRWGSTYRFYSVARDNVGNVESAPATPDAVTTVATLVPQVTATLPNAAASGGPGFPLRVNGRYFTPKSVARWNGANLPTTYVSDTQLTAEVPQALIAAAGRADISVLTPPPGGGTSNSVSFVVTAVQPFAAFAHDASIPGTVTLNTLPNGATLIDAQVVLRYDPTQMDAITAGDITPLGSWSVVDFTSENGLAVIILSQIGGAGQSQAGKMLALTTRPVAGLSALTAPVLTLAGGSYLTDQSSKSYPVNDSVTLLPGRTRQLSGRIIGTPSAGVILNEKVIAVEAGNFLHVMKASDLTDVPTFLPIDLGAPVKGRITFGVVGGRPVFSAGTSHGFLRVFDAVTGIPVQIGAANPLGSAIDTAPAIDNATGDVYVGVDHYNGGNRAALIRFRSGKPIVALLEGDRVTGSPAVYGSYAIIGTNKGVQLLRIEDSGFIPQASIPVTNINTAAIISTSANALVSRTNDAGTAVLMQLNLITGQPAQQTLPLGPSSGPLSQGFGYAPVTYGGNDGALYRIQSGPTGPVLAGTVSPFLGPISPQPIVIDGVTYAVDNDGNFRSTAGVSFNINWRPTNAIAATGVKSGSDSLLLATQEGVVISMPF